MKKIFLCLIFFLLVQLQARSVTHLPTNKVFSVNGWNNYTLFNINNWFYWQTNDGVSGHNPFNGNAGGIYPNPS